MSKEARKEAEHPEFRKDGSRGGEAGVSFSQPCRMG